MDLANAEIISLSDESLAHTLPIKPFTSSPQRSLPFYPPPTHVGGDAFPANDRLFVAPNSQICTNATLSFGQGQMVSHAIPSGQFREVGMIAAMGPSTNPDLPLGFTPFNSPLSKATSPPFQTQNSGRLMDTQSIASSQLDTFDSMPPIASSNFPDLDLGAVVSQPLDSSIDSLSFHGTDPARQIFAQSVPIRQVGIAGAMPLMPAPSPSSPCSLLLASKHLRDSGIAVSHLPSKSKPAGRPVEHTAEDWARHKEAIRDLYLTQRKTLKQLMGIMETQYGFWATTKMYKTKFTQWGFSKNNNEEEIKRILSTKLRRDIAGKVSHFTRNGNRKVEVLKYLKRKGKTEYDLLDFNIVFDKTQRLPPNVRCTTPPPRFLSEPEVHIYQQRFFAMLRDSLMLFNTLAEQGPPVTMSSEEISEGNSVVVQLNTQKYSPTPLLSVMSECRTRMEKWLSNLRRGPMPLLSLLQCLGDNLLADREVSLLLKFLASWTSGDIPSNHPLRRCFYFLYEIQQVLSMKGAKSFLFTSAPLIAKQVETIFGPHHPYTLLCISRMYKSADGVIRARISSSLRNQGWVEQLTGLSHWNGASVRFMLLFYGIMENREWSDRLWTTTISRLKSQDRRERHTACILCRALAPHYIKPAIDVPGDEHMRVRSVTCSLELAREVFLEDGLFRCALACDKILFGIAMRKGQRLNRLRYQRDLVHDFKLYERKMAGGFM